MSDTQRWFVGGGAPAIGGHEGRENPPAREQVHGPGRPRSIRCRAVSEHREFDACIRELADRVLGRESGGEGGGHRSIIRPG